MSHEIEMKFKVADLAEVAGRLRRLGARRLGAALQNDTYLDTASRRLLKAGCGLRLRTVRSLGRGGRRETGATLTYKGPARRGAKAKIRPEIQTAVSNPQAVEAVLAACGLRPMLILQKRRASYRLGRCAVELDELPLLGCFVEIEGPSEAAIQSVRRRLALAGPPIRSHYVSLATRACPRAGRTCLAITFANCRRCGRA